jgi:hypothetical protein
MYEAVDWQEGFGDVKHGHFPSAHESAVRRIRIPTTANKRMESNG